MENKLVKIYTTGNEVKLVNVAHITLVENVNGKTLVHISNGTTLFTTYSLDEIFKLINGTKTV